MHYVFTLETPHHGANGKLCVFGTLRASRPQRSTLVQVNRHTVHLTVDPQCSVLKSPSGLNT